MVIIKAAGGIVQSFSVFLRFFSRADPYLNTAVFLRQDRIFVKQKTRRQRKAPRYDGDRTSARYADRRRTAYDRQHETRSVRDRLAHLRPQQEVSALKAVEKHTVPVVQQIAVGRRKFRLNAYAGRAGRFCSDQTRSAVEMLRVGLFADRRLDPGAGTAVFGRSARELLILGLQKAVFRHARGDHGPRKSSPQQRQRSARGAGAALIPRVVPRNVGKPRPVIEPQQIELRLVPRPGRFVRRQRGAFKAVKPSVQR